MPLMRSDSDGEAKQILGLLANRLDDDSMSRLNAEVLVQGKSSAAVISIGTATLAAFIGAGGLGEPIVTGLSLNDSQLILQGAIPAAALAILTELLFEWLERLWVPAHMRSAQLSS